MLNFRATRASITFDYAGVVEIRLTKCCVDELCTRRLQNRESPFAREACNGRNGERK